MRHLSTRAVEWLRAAEDPVTYTTKVGTYACNQKHGNETIRVADVRAMVRGYPQATERVKGKTVTRDIYAVDCLACIAILETELSTTRQKHHRFGRSAT